MALFPQSFLDDLKAQSDVVAIIGEVTPLKKMGATWKGLCPFHQEKTPSFTVNGDKGVYHCFGCGVGGDVVRFVQEYQKVSFTDAVRYLAQRASLPLPEVSGDPAERAAAAMRESLIRLHEVAATFFREQLATSAGARARRELESRGLSAETQQVFGYGYAPADGRALAALFAEQRIPRDVQRQTGLVLERDGGRLVDRFRNRLMIPIARDSGAIVAFGGRALDAGQVPKYLNSSETPIYTKGRTLYGLHVTKAAIKQRNYSVAVEGYFDLAQVWQAGVQSVVALCGTALTPAQARLLKRFTSKVVLSLDPDAAGQGAAARSSELLVAEGFDVNVALLPPGEDPDTFVRRQGGRAYVERLTGSQPYLEFLLDRAAAGVDLNRRDGQKKFLDAMLGVAATIPDAASRDRFADRLAHTARITEGVVREEIRKAAARKQTTAPAVVTASSGTLRPAEQGLLWALVHRPLEGLAALGQLQPEDLEGLLSASTLGLASGLVDLPPETIPEVLRDRLTESEWALVERAARVEAPAAPAADCVGALKRLRVDRERAAVQDEIDRLQERAAPDDGLLLALWTRKKELLRQLDELT